MSRCPSDGSVCVAGKAQHRAALPVDGIIERGIHQRVYRRHGRGGVGKLAWTAAPLEKSRPFESSTSWLPLMTKNFVSAPAALSCPRAATIFACVSSWRFFLAYPCSARIAREIRRANFGDGYFHEAPSACGIWPYGRSGPLSLLRSVGVLRRTELYRLQIMACSCQEGVRRRRDCGAFLEGCLSNSRKAEGRRVHCRSRVLRPALSRLPAACPAEGFVSLAGCASCCWLHASPVSLPGFLKTAYILKRGRRPARMGRSRRLLRRGGRLRRAGCR